MLQSMRKSAGGWVAKGLMLLLVASFGLWGVADYLGVYQEPPVADVGDTKITRNDFTMAVRRDVAQLQQRLGPSFDVAAAKRLGVPDSTLSTMVESALIQQEVQRLGLRASADAVRQAILAAPAFQGPGGQFDRAAFENFMRNEGYTEGALVAQLARDLLRDQLLSSLGVGLDSAPKAMVDALYKYRNERRTADYIVLPDADRPAPPPPTAEQLAKFHQDSANLFTAPEYRELKWLVLRPEDFADEGAVAADAIRAEYDARAASYQTAEQRSIEQAVYSTEMAARSARELMKGADDFYPVIERTLKQKPADTQLGSVTREDLPAALGAPVFDLPPGEISQPIRSPLGWHVVRVTAITPATTRTLADATPEIRRYLALDKATERLVKLTQQVDDKLGSGATLDETAAGLDLKVGSATVDSRGRDRQGQAAALPPIPRFLQTAFSAEERNEPFFSEGENGSQYLVRVERIVAPTLRPLDEVKAQVEAAWTAAERARASTAAAQALADKAKAGGDFAALATEAGTQVQVSRPALRSGRDADAQLGPRAVTQLFRLKPGEAVVTRSAGDDASIVLRLGRVEPADIAQATPEELAEIGRSLAGATGEDVQGALRSTLESRFPVRVNQQAKEAAF